MIRAQAQRLIVTRQRVIEPPKLVQNNATVAERFNVMWLQIKRAIVAGQCCFAASQFVQRVSAIAERIGIVRP